MSADKNWQFELEEYIKQGEPSQIEKSEAYLLDTAKEHIEGNIAKLLGEKAFQFSPAEWLAIHRRLFEGVFSHAGQIRQYNITKKEWVLKGDTVIYATTKFLELFFSNLILGTNYELKNRYMHIEFDHG